MTLIFSLATLKRLEVVRLRCTDPSLCIEKSQLVLDQLLSLALHIMSILRSFPFRHLSPRPPFSAPFRVLSTSTPRPSSTSPVPPVPRYLGYSGALPFVILGPSAFLFSDPFTARMVHMYGASILSFLGGVHWGRALHSSSPFLFMYSVVPSLVATTAAFMPPDQGLKVLGGGLAAAWICDEFLVRDGWYTKLRRPLSVAAVLGCLAAAKGMEKSQRKDLTKQENQKVIETQQQVQIVHMNEQKESASEVQMKVGEINHIEQTDEQENSEPKTDVPQDE